MNKLTKNKIFFNLEKIISITVATSILIAILSLTTSCTTATHLCDKYSTPKTIYKCPVFTN